MPEVPADFWADAAIRAAAQARHMGRLIRAWRCHSFHGRTAYPQEAVARWMRLTQAQLSKIENGAPIQHLDRLVQWAVTLRVPPTLLWFALPDTWAPASSSEQADAGIGEQRFDEGEVSGVDEEDRMRRRTVLHGLLGSLGQSLLASPADGLSAESLRRGVDEDLHGPATSADADEWERTARQYSYEVGAQPPQAVAPRLLLDLDELRLRLRTASGDVRDRLTGVSAQLTALSAIALLNVGQPDAARRFWRTAVRASSSTGDVQLQALIRGRRAVFALYDSTPPATVLAFADGAIDLTQGASAGAAGGYAARAQMLARIGRRDEAMVALHRLADVFDAIADSAVQDRASQWGWSEQRLRHVQSFVLSHAGDVPRAVQAQSAALALYPSTSYQGRAQIGMHQALCLMTSGDPSEAGRQVVRTLIGLPAAVRNDALVRRSAAAVIDVAPEGALQLPAVSEARELLDTDAAAR
ncbi:hypothetical protein [Dactylosporangium sp. NPDC051541]|uniref:hypothetical protein n=1 Tax=Dactylosporangium sp. NPDC051541 TaxID=3363977 RepID=UPI0037A5E4B3